MNESNAMFDIKYCDYSEYYERPKYGQSNIIYEEINICFKFQMRRIQFPPKKIFTKSERKYLNKEENN